jgi:hypothetical protein
MAITEVAVARFPFWDIPVAGNHQLHCEARTTS